MNTHYFILFVTAVAFATKVDGVPICDSPWVPYGNAKCIQIIDQFATQENAFSLCTQLATGEGNLASKEDAITPLLTIQSAEEQEFLTQLIYGELHVLDNIWLAASRISNDSDFLWPDGTPLEYANWHEGYPSETEGNNCVQMVPKGLKGLRSKSVTQGAMATVDGTWTDEACGRRNLVVCQRKSEPLTLDRLAEVAQENRKILDETRRKVHHLKENPVPIDFIHVQISGQSEPTVIWPNVQWADITNEYAGLFFRAQGEGSDSFGTVQQDSTRQLFHGIHEDIWAANGNDGCASLLTMPQTGESERFRTGYWGTYEYTDCLRFETSDSEVRPKNMAIRIWKRTG